MKYIELKITFNSTVTEEQKGIYISDFGDMGCDSFAEERQQLMGYITATDYEKNRAEISEYLKTLPALRTEINEIADQNWNSVWEANFDPIEVNELCGIRAPFHGSQGKELEVVIMPRMAFGTGHHQTTRLMIEGILSMDVRGKRGLDMGCGTGVLAIVSLMRGAVAVDAIDIDEWAYDNVIENATHNGVKSNIKAFWGDASLLEHGGELMDARYDFVLANINRNILLRDMNIYLSHLCDGGSILFSGFLEDDITMMTDKAVSLGLTPAGQANKDKWYMLKFTK